MKIKQALFTAGYSSFYFDDQQAIKNGAGHDGFIYTGAPVTPGFTSVRQAGECVSVQLILENGAVAVEKVRTSAPGSQLLFSPASGCCSRPKSYWRLPFTD